MNYDRLLKEVGEVAADATQGLRSAEEDGEFFAKERRVLREGMDVDLLLTPGGRALRVLPQGDTEVEQMSDRDYTGDPVIDADIDREAAERDRQTVAEWDPTLPPFPDEAAVEALAQALDATFASHDVGPLPLVGPRGLAARTVGNLAASGWSLRRSEPPTADEEIDYRDLAGYASLAFFEERAATQALRADPRRSICGVVSNSGPNGEPLACAYPPSPEDDPMHEHSWATLPTFAATPAVDEALVDEITRFREALRVSFAGSEWQRMEQAAASAALLGLTLHDDEHWDAPGSCRDDEQDCPECGGAGYDTATASDNVWRYPACGTCGGTGLAGSDQ